MNWLVRAVRAVWEFIVGDDPLTAAGVVVALGATALIVLVMSRERVRLGVRGTRGESMLFDLRERLQAQGRVPILPQGWHLELALKSAGGQSFGRTLKRLICSTRLRWELARATPSDTAATTCSSAASAADDASASPC